MDRLSALKQRIENRKIGNDVCFFCAKQYPQSHISMEHVFPKWLQNKFELWNQHIHLINTPKHRGQTYTIDRSDGI